MLEDLGRCIQELVIHELNIITDSEWFEDLVKVKAAEILQQAQEK